MGQFGMGQTIQRVEDQRFLTGTGRYTDDITIEGAAHMVFVRSPYAHADISSINLDDARAAEGVVGVFTVDDLLAEGLNPLPIALLPSHKTGEQATHTERYGLAKDTVRYVGEPVVAVVAETLAQARDAAELVDIDYAEKPAVGTLEAAAADGAPEIYDFAPGNVLVDWEMGDAAATDKAFADAERVVSLNLINNRLAPTAMEPRGAIADYDAADERWTVHVGTQGAHTHQKWLAQGVFNVDLDRMHVITPDVGGGFGMRMFLFAETVNVVFAARALKRPVRWIGDRSEAFLNDVHGRDQVSEAELALKNDGTMLGIRVKSLGNLGAYASQFGGMVLTMAGCGMLTGCYKLPAAHVSVKVMVTNTAPTDAYRGAGRPEAAYLVERLVDKAARELGMSPADIRRKNFIPEDAFPFATVLGPSYDSGRYAELMDRAMQKADWSGFAARKAAATARGKHLGIGMSYYIEQCGGGGGEDAHVKFEEDGSITIMVGTQSTGQGHETAFAQIVSDALSIPMENIRVLQGDTDVIPSGGGTGGSRSIPVCGNSVQNAAEKVIEHGKAVAANVLEAAEVDIEFENGTFTISGTDRSISIADVAAASYDDSNRPDGKEPGLYEMDNFAPPAGTFPNGCHICEVEVDQETGVVEIVNFTVVDDIGRILNPMLLRGQILGGIGQGIGQALCEEAVYEPDSGQIVTGSFMDYHMPRADVFPDIDFEYEEVPCPNNPMGVKGAGEAGTIGAPPAVVNAVIDALQDYGVTHLDMPVTPLKVWQAMQTPARAAAE